MRLKQGVDGRDNKPGHDELMGLSCNGPHGRVEETELADYAADGLIMMVEWPRTLALTLMLLAAMFGWRKGRSASAAGGRAPAWTNIPLIALAIVSIGPSLCAAILYLTYRFGLVQPPASGYRFGSFVTLLPADFALMNWAFVPLYVVCRVWPGRDGARLAMWLSVVAMSLPCVVLFALAPEMLSTARDAGQGIGIVEAVLLWSPIAAIVPGVGSIIMDAGTAWMSVLMPLAGFLPMLGLMAWLLGRFAGRAVRKELGANARKADDSKA
jgi:hypothetical protein